VPLSPIKSDGMFRVLKPAVLFIVGLALVGILSLALQSWSIARDSRHMENRAADKIPAATGMALGSGRGG